MPAKKPATATVISAADMVQALSDIYLDVKKKRFAITQSGMDLKDDQRMLLDADYDAARDAYFKGLSDFVDAAEPTIATLMKQARATATQLDALAMEQANAAKLLDAISGLVGLAGKILALGTL